MGAALLNTLTPLQLLAQNGGWGGYTGEGDYRDANGDTLEVMQAGHSVRDGAFDKALTAASQGRDVSPARCDELRAVLIVTAGQNVLDKLHEFAYIASTAYCPGHEEAVRGTAQTAIDAGNDLLRSVCLTAHRLG